MVATRRTTASRRAWPAPRRVRIIPVSVLGLDAIEEVIEQEQNGEVVHVPVKRRDFRHAPINLAVPVAAIIPDRLDQILAGLSPRQRRRAQRRVRLALLRSQSRSFRRFGGTIVGAAQDGLGTMVGAVLGPVGSGLAKPVLALAAEWLAQQPDPQRALDLRASEERVQAVRRIEARAAYARRDLLQRFAAQVRSFEENYPGWDAETGLEERERRIRSTT